MSRVFQLVMCCVLVTITGLASAAQPQDLQFEQRWVQALGIADTESRAQALKQLEADLTVAVKADPESAGLWIVRGNANMEIASALNSMSSISYLNDGKEYLEKAMVLQPMAMDGMAEASLAAAMYWAPGWPISYGDTEDALALFERSIKDNPRSMELLTQYAHILREGEKKPKQAVVFYNRALEAVDSTAMHGRDLLRDKRMAEIKEAMASLK